MAQPFVDADQTIHAFFPDRYWAVALPAGLIVLGVSVVLAFLGVMSLKAPARATTAAPGTGIKDD